MLKWFVVLLVLILWPLNLLLNSNRLKLSPETIFKNDYQGEQLILRNINLYPNILLARIFQNKPRIYINKFAGNILSLTDPNYYFFAAHPTPITGNLNLYKFPFMAIIFFIIGIFYIGNSRYKKIILYMTLPGILMLSTLINFEGFDFILWLPISLIILNGIVTLEKLRPNLFKYFSIVFILFSIPEIVRSFYNI